MGICDSNKNQTPIANNIEPSTETNQVQTTPSQQPIQNVTSKVEQNINSNTDIINNNANITNGNEQNEIDRPSNINRSASLGSSVKNEDSIGYNQTRETYAY